jgi:hypothetical protein
MVPVKCTLVCEVPPSDQIVLTFPLPAICPVHAMLAVIPVGDIEMLVTWQSPRPGVGAGPPYLSIIAWVTHTWLLLGAPLKGDPGGACIPGGIGDCWKVMVVVTSNKPGFLVPCPQAQLAIAKKQQTKVTQTRLLRIFPPDRFAQALARAIITLLQGRWRGKEKFPPKMSEDSTR